jgi:hypothetical protein
MTMKDFIRNNRTDLEAAITRARDFVPRTASCDCQLSRTDHVHARERALSLSDIREWVVNDEGLYSWARSEGVRV